MNAHLGKMLALEEAGWRICEGDVLFLQHFYKSKIISEIKMV